MDKGNNDMQYVNMRSLQERPITLGELLMREEGMEAVEPAPPRSMGRTMSPTRCLGPLAIGRPRRPRARTMTRLSTSLSQSEDGPSDSQMSRQSQPRRRSTALGPLTLPALARWRSATAVARIRNLRSLMNGSLPTRRRETRNRHRSLGRSESPDLFFNPFSWQRRRRDPMGIRQTRPRSRHIFPGRSQRLRSSFMRATPGTSRMIDLYDSREEQRSFRYLRAGRPHSGRADPEVRSNTTNGTSQSQIPDPVLRFINFAAEFIPVEEQSPDAEPPEWSFNITAADFGPFAIGRSALSRARSLAIMGVLSQLTDEPADAQPHPTDN